MCSVCPFSWCKYSHHGLISSYQFTLSLIRAGKTDAVTELYIEYFYHLDPTDINNLKNIDNSER